MKDLLTRLQAVQQETLLGVVDDSAPQTDRGMEDIAKAARLCLQRLYHSRNSAATHPEIANKWRGEIGRRRCLAFAINLARTEYQPGFLFSGRLGSGRVHILSEETATWFPVALSKLLGNHCARKANALPYGLWESYGVYYWRDLSGVTQRSSKAWDAHLGFVLERRDVLAYWIDHVGPRTAKLLRKRIERIDALLGHGLTVDYL